MDNFKFIVFSIITLSLVGLFTYWAFNSIQSGTEHKMTEKIDTLQNENEDLKEENEDLKGKLAKLEVSVSTEEPAPVVEEPVVTPTSPKPTTPKLTPTPTKPTTYKNQTLINELQKMLNAGTSLKLGSSGASVASVQKFLNIYNKTSNKVDNDYGESTKVAVVAFQKAQSLPGSGEVHKATLTKMVDWLKKQG
ncbi:MAG: peptidoglycan-binding protein [Patescibacteria group bacterium]